MTFFWTTPVGRILNRLSRDVDNMDLLLPFALDQFFGLFLQALGIFVAVAIVYPVAISTFPFLLLGFALCIFYLRAGMRQFRRLGGVIRSFVASELDTCITGASTIRAMDCYPQFERRFEARVECEVNCDFHSWMLGNYMGLRFNLLVSLFTFLVSIVAIATRTSGASGALGSLAVSYSMRLAASFQWSVRNLIDVEAYMTSVERLIEYTNIEMEVTPELEFVFLLLLSCLQPQTGVCDPGPSWPSRGHIAFDNVWLRYRPDQPWVLKGVSFEAPSCSSLGIVGRTGSGKAKRIFFSFFNLVSSYFCGLLFS